MGEKKKEPTPVKEKVQKKEKVAKNQKNEKKDSEEEEDPFDYYNQQLPTEMLDIYNIGDKTQEQI